MRRVLRSLLWIVGIMLVLLLLAFGVAAAVPVSYTHLTLPTNREV